MDFKWTLAVLNFQKIIIITDCEVDIIEINYNGSISERKNPL